MQKSRGLHSVSTVRTASGVALQRTRKVALHAVAGVLLLTAMAGCKRTPNPNVWATVNGHTIMKAEVEKYFQNKVSAMQQKPTADESAMLRLDIVHQ
ncbi:MAG: hypothetical protein ABI064_02440, partial [Acidobacteriaceae bacterium]